MKSGVGRLARNGREGGIDLAAGTGVDDLDLQPHGAGSRFHVSQLDAVIAVSTGLRSTATRAGCGHQLPQEFQPFCRQLRREKIDAGQVAVGPGEVRDQTKPDRVFGDHEDDGDRRGRLGRGLRCGPTGDHGDPSANKLRRQCGQPIDLIVGPTVFNRNVLALDVAGVLQTLAESAQKSEIASCVWLLRNPTTGIAVCCASAASGHAAAEPPSSVMNSRRFTRSNCICCPSQGLPWHHTALARIKLGAHCSAGF